MKIITCQKELKFWIRTTSAKEGRIVIFRAGKNSHSLSCGPKVATKKDKFHFTPFFAQKLPVTKK